MFETVRPEQDSGFIDPQGQPIPPISERRAQPSQQPPGEDGGFFIEEAAAPRPRREGPPPTVAETAADVGRSALAGTARGVVGMPGIIGDIGALFDIAGPSYRYYTERPFERMGLAPEGGAQRQYERAMATINAARTPEEREGLRNRVLGWSAPTSQYFVRAAAPYVPGLTYESTTGPGRIAATAGEIVGGAPVGGVPGVGLGVVRGTVAAPRIASALGREMVRPTTLGAGLGAGVSGEYLAETLGEGPSRLIGALGGAGVAAAAQRRLPAGVRERGEQIAGEIYRERLPVSPEEAGRALNVPPGTLVPGAAPTPGQLLGEQGRAATALGERFGAQEAQQARTATREAVSEAGQTLRQNIEDVRPHPSMSEALGLPAGSNPLAVSSQSARNLFSQVENALFEASENAWRNPALNTATYHFSPVYNALREFRARIGPTTFNNLDPIVVGRLNDLMNLHPSQSIPLELIRRAREEANAVLRSPGARNVPEHAELSRVLRDVLTDENNITSLGDAAAASAWRTANDLHRQYQQTIGTDYLRRMAETYPSPAAGQRGAYRIPETEMLDRTLSNPASALTNYRQLRNVPGIDQAGIDRAVGDWLVANFTNNGTRVDFTPNQLSNFMRRYHSIIDEVPGLRGRFDDIAAQSRTDRLLGGFSSVLDQNDLTKLSTFLRQHGTDLQAILPAHQRALIPQLQRSSELLRPLTGGRIDQSRLLRFMEDGDLFSVLHGQALGFAPRFAAGATAGYLTSRFVPALSGFEAIAGLASGAGLQWSGPAIASRIFYGNVQRAAQEALRRAADDPEYLRMLLRRPNPQDILNPFSRNGWAHFLTEVSPEAANYAQLGLRAPVILQQQDREQQQPQRRYIEPIRPTRASGGRIGKNYRAKAQALILAAERAKKQHNKTTEPILGMADETVAKALSLANEAI